MPDWIASQEWWRFSWIPLVTAFLIYFATIFKAKTEGRGAMDARLDGRLDRLVATQAAEIDRVAGDNERLRTLLREAREARDTAERRLDHWQHFGRDLHHTARRLRHDINNIRHIFQVEAAKKGIRWLDEPPLPDLPGDV